MTLSTAVAISLEDGKPKYKGGKRLPNPQGNIIDGPIPHEKKDLNKMKKKDKDENEKLKEKFVKIKGKSKKDKK